MAEFFSIVSERPEQKIFIHCWLGGHRTGVFLAAYRCFDHWSVEHALEKMHAFHFKAFWHPALTKYVRAFPQRLATSPALAPYRHAQEPGVASLGAFRTRRSSPEHPLSLQ